MRTPSQPLLLGCGCCKSRYGVFERPWHPPHGPLGDFEAARRRGAGRLTTPIQEWAAERGFECLPVHSGTLKPWATGNGPGGGRPSPKLLNTREGGILDENSGAQITRCLTRGPRRPPGNAKPEGQGVDQRRGRRPPRGGVGVGAGGGSRMPGERTRYAEPALLRELRKKGPEMDGTMGAWRRSDSSWLPEPRAFRPGLQVRPSWSRWSAVQRRAYIMGGQMPGAEGKYPPE